MSTSPPTCCSLAAAEPWENYQQDKKYIGIDPYLCEFGDGHIRIIAGAMLNFANKRQTAMLGTYPVRVARINRNR